MKSEVTEVVSVDRKVYTLRHLETAEFICLRHDAKEFVACFTDGDTAGQFRQELGLVEFVDIEAMQIGDTPFDNYWLDGNMIGRAMLTSRERAVQHA